MFKIISEDVETGAAILERTDGHRMTVSRKRLSELQQRGLIEQK